MIFKNFPNKKYLAYLRKQAKAIVIDEFVLNNGFRPVTPPPNDVVDPILYKCISPDHDTEAEYWQAVRWAVRAQLQPNINN